VIHNKKGQCTKDMEAARTKDNGEDGTNDKRLVVMPVIFLSVVVTLFWP